MKPCSYSHDWEGGFLKQTPSGPKHAVRCKMCFETKEAHLPKAPEGAPESALTTQVGGTHYKDMPIQPIEFITKNELSYPVGCAIKYLCRYKRKGGIQDLEKANHYIDLLIEMEGEV